MKKDTSTQLTVIEWLEYLPKRLRVKAREYAKEDPNYEVNKTFKTDCIKKALVMAFSFETTSEGYKHWWYHYDTLGIPQPYIIIEAKQPKRIEEKV